MVAAGGDRDRVGQAAHHDRRRRVGRWCRSPTDRRCCRPSISRCRSPTTHTNGRRRPRSRPRSIRPLTTTGVDELVVVPFPNSPEVVVAPAFGGAVRQQRTRMDATCGDRDRLLPTTGRSPPPASTSCVGGAVPQLTVAVQAPALGGPVRQQRTRMGAARGDRDRVGQAAHHHRRRRVGRGAVAQLPEAVEAPALGGPVRQQRTRMVGRPRRSRSRWSGRSPPPASTSWSWCRCPTGRRRCRPSIWRSRSPTTHTNA